MKYIVTSALPYANGKLHVGHVAGAYLPADIFVRFLRLKNEDVIYICGTDEHGTPISISADKEGVSPKEVAQKYHDLIKEAFDGIGIEFDNFSGTSRPDHYQISQDFFVNLYEKGHIKPVDTLQHYCEHDERFLPDRYVEGVCSKCGADGARGDQCDVCGQVYDTVSLKAPKCKICGNVPIIKDTRHWFLQLDDFSGNLADWIEHKTYWKENVRNFMLNLLKQGLVERSITRDLSWGIPVPLPEAEGKVLYVWFDAPIGYISSTIEWAKRIGDPERWKDYWLHPDTRLIHFIGKDNIIFHSIIWPAMLMGQKLPYCLPYDIPANEFMNLEGQKISTSRNWAIWVDEIVKDFNGEYLRYYLAVNAPETKDSDFSFKDFQQKVNNELNNVLGNLVNRVLAFSKKHFEGIISPVSLSSESLSILSETERLCAECGNAYENYQVKKATKLIMDIARGGNKYFDDRKPWVTVKTKPALAMETLFVCLNLLRKISVILYPILPKTMLELRKMVGITDSGIAIEWNELDNLISDSVQINDVKPLFTKIEDNQIEEQLLKLAQNVPSDDKVVLYKPVKDTISYDQFGAMDIRIAEVLSAEPVPNTDKLLHLKVNIGIEVRELVAGIAQNYNAADIVGKKIVMLVNLEPRKIRGIVSQGMILAAEFDGTLSLLHPHKDMNPGATIQ